MQQYEKDFAEWEKMQEIAYGVLNAQPAAYIAAIQETNPFSDIAELGSAIECRTDSDWYIEALLHVNGEQVVPSEVKSLLQSGRLSTKKMPKGQFYELYQDHICSCVIRVARELFALLPVQMVFVHAISERVNPQTGYKDNQTVLSVAIPRDTLMSLNFETIDCSDAMKNFVHRMGFSKTKGFSTVEALKPHDFRPKF
ncbi:MAG: hypothetical protein RMK99_12125 [Anaerolineales bacterium]|nr:hypothetical protein [Anaerolineales bacterium]